MKKGFTLVELSIVLVIIGLLIGGVLVGQSLIASATIAHSVQQISQYDAAALSFKSKYKGLPGDVASMPGPLYGPVTAADDQIYAHGWMLGTGNGTSCIESFNFWYNLSSSGELAESFKGYDGFANFSGDFTGYAPSLKIGKKRKCFVNAVTVNNLADPAWDFAFGNAWIIAGSDVSNPSYAHCLSYAEALSFEGKLDNGDLGTGDIRTIYPYSGPRVSGDSLSCSANGDSCALAMKPKW